MPLQGRQLELTLLDEVLASAGAGQGSALIVRGAAGIGKSCLLLAALRRAQRRGFSTLSIAGAEAEAALPFAGLHQLVMPMAEQVPHLTGRLQRAVRAAFGEDDHPADVFTLGLAVLELLEERATACPLLLLVEDAHWLDPETLEVIGFVCRRLRDQPVVVLAAVREQYPGVLTTGGLAQLNLQRLDDQASRRLLRASAPGLGAEQRERVLNVAEGNPLALVELPGCLHSASPAHTEALEGLLPVNERLVNAFADRLAQLPPPTRAVLTVLAVDTTLPLTSLLTVAGELVRGAAPPPVLDSPASTRPTVAAPALAAAVDAGLLLTDGHRLRFRHPLVRAAVYSAASMVERVVVHTAVADVLADDLDRRAWHRAAAALATDEQVSSELGATAGRAIQRGALGVAVNALERAASLSEDAARRTSLLLQAAEITSQLNDRTRAVELVSHADWHSMDLAARARLVLVQDITDPGDLHDADRVGDLVRLAAQLVEHDLTDLAVAVCWRAASRCWWGAVPESSGQAVVDVFRRLGLHPDDPRTLAVEAYAQSQTLGASVLQRLAHLVPDRSDVDAMRFLGGAALVLGDFVTASSYMATAAAGYRAQGRAALLARTLSSVSFIRLWLGDWPALRAGAEEAAALAEESADAFWALAARATQALHEAMRGQSVGATAHAERVLADPDATGVHFVAEAAQHTRGLAAAFAGRHEEAFELLLRCFDPTSPNFHPDMSGWALPDLADAAARARRTAEAQEIVARYEARSKALPSPALIASVAYARTIVCPETEREDAFAAAFALDLSQWPVHRGRLQLAYGSWLRRRKRILECRAPLREARDTLEALGAGWAPLAREELRASGEDSAGPLPQAREQLTAQELQVAILAAEGLSNREIGQRLFLSHRTVGSHLYRLYPKLGISGRAHLRTAMAHLQQPPSTSA
ncbi:AAA family ATPase [Kineococcus sp. SYSU DK006]|uniref:AAA family ATPase n=1 Tax=Kineococcus sp. SYSU DK006 TaxID=3383127 RepID=UPI003D7CB6AF